MRKIVKVNFSRAMSIQQRELFISDMMKEFQVVGR
jgi:hypothetical protein